LPGDQGQVHLPGWGRARDTTPALYQSLNKKAVEIRTALKRTFLAIQRNLAFPLCDEDCFRWREIWIKFAGQQLFMSVLTWQWIEAEQVLRRLLLIEHVCAVQIWKPRWISLYKICNLLAQKLWTFGNTGKSPKWELISPNLITHYNRLLQCLWMFLLFFFNFLWHNVSFYFWK
jgi:hypothetical protein